jgi:hypothetical protein
MTVTIDNSVNLFINKSLEEENERKSSLHEPSGKLSAGMLYQPLRVQVLKAIGAPRKKLEAYTIGKFKRGDDVEEWFVGKLGEMGVLVERQKKIEYRGCIGFADAIVDSDQMFYKRGIIPHEVKSVTNAKLRMISKTEVDYHYKIQACYYALGTNAESYAVDIVSAEDLQPKIYVFDTKDMKDEVDLAISLYQEAMKNWEERKVLPVFEPNPKVKWTANPLFSMFDEFWLTGSDTEIIRELEKIGAV